MDIRTIPINQIVMGEEQVRSDYSEEGIRLLRDSLVERGLQQPIKVRMLSSMPLRFMIIHGHRRYLAALDAGWKNIDCILAEGREITHEYDKHVASLVENEVRENLNIWDKGVAFLRAIELRREEYHEDMSLRALGRRTGIANQTISEAVAYVKETTPEIVKKDSDACAQTIEKSVTSLPATHVREVRRAAPDLPREERVNLVKAAVEEGWTHDEVREAAEIRQAEISADKGNEELDIPDNPETIIKKQTDSQSRPSVLTGTEEGKTLMSAVRGWRSGITFVNRLWTNYSLNQDDVKKIRKYLSEIKENVSDLLDMMEDNDDQ